MAHGVEELQSQTMKQRTAGRSRKHCSVLCIEKEYAEPISSPSLSGSPQGAEAEAEALNPPHDPQENLLAGSGYCSSKAQACPMTGLSS